MAQNSWIKVAAVSVGAMILIFALLFGINQFSGVNSYNQTSENYGYYMHNQDWMNGNINNNMNNMYNYGMQQGGTGINNGMYMNMQNAPQAQNRMKMGRRMMH